MGVIRKFRSRAGGRAWAALKKETDAAKRWGPAGCAGSPRVLELSSTRISPRGVKIFFHRGWFPATDTHAPWPPRSSLSSVQSLFRPVYYGSARYCLSASVSFTIVINHSRNHWRGDSRSWWEREREFRWEKRTMRRNDRTTILRVSLSAGSFSPSLFFSFSRALCRRCTFLRFRSSRISIPPRFSLLFGILFHLNFYSSLIRFDISGLELWGIVNNRYRHYCFLLNFRI